MGLHLAAPHAADAVVVLDDAAMRVQLAVGQQTDEVAFVIAADE